VHIPVIIDYAVQSLLVVGLLVSTWFYCTTYVAAWFFLGRKRRQARVGETSELPGMTILKPLKGLEVDLFENLSSFCRQDYPTFQVVFGVASADDPAIDVVRSVQAHHPNVRIDLIVDSHIHGSNYKISNLQNMDRVSLYEVLVIADSDMRVRPDYLRRLAADVLDPTVGVVTCIYRAVGTGGLPTLIESLFINADFAPSILVARVVEKTRYAFGATMALRRGVLDEIGGFQELSNYLADDFFLGNRVVARGYRVLISDMVVETVLAVSSWKQLFDHQLRWARTYRSVRGGSYFALALTHGALWAILNLVWNGFSTTAWLIAAMLCALRLITANRVANRYLHAPMRWYETLCMPLKDLIGTAVWFLAFLGDGVHWSGNQFRVLGNGQMVRRAGSASPPLPTYHPAKR
jgi:ceramide glucosyltransferase